MTKTYFLIALLVLPATSMAQDRSRHDIAMNAIRNVKAVVDTTPDSTIKTIGSSLITIAGNVGDPIPGCVGRVCGGAISGPATP